MQINLTDNPDKVKATLKYAAHVVRTLSQGPGNRSGKPGMIAQDHINRLERMMAAVDEDLNQNTITISREILRQNPEDFVAWLKNEMGRNGEV